jgi:flagellar biosynthesis/type III secretory pathway chaperone
MQSTTLSLEEFEKTLSEIYDNLQQFILTLETEKSFLENSKYDELEASLEAKTLLIHTLEEIAVKCQALLSTAHFPFNETSINSIIAQFPAYKQSDLQNKWVEIKELLKTCDQKNLVNGVMITTLKNYNNHMLHILTQRPKESVYSNQSKKMYTAAVSTREHKA